MTKALPSLRVGPLLTFFALVAGLASGMGIAALVPEYAEQLANVADPVGTLWLRALQMTIVPLVVALLVTGIVGSVEAARAGKVAGRSMLLFVLVLWAVTILSAFVTPAILAAFPPPEAAARAIAGGAATAEVGVVPGFGEFVKSIIPSNPIAAAANDAILPLVVFTLAFALAVTRLAPGPRAQLAGLFSALADAMLVIIGWALAVAPIGVFALAFVVGARIGTDAIGIFLHYILTVASLGAIVLIAAYPVAVLGGRRRLGAFVRAVLPSQAMAISTQSSLATLPAMLKATAQLGVRPATADVTLPLAVALFRATSPAMNLAVAIYVAHLAGVELSAAALIAGVAVAATTTMGSVSLPGSISFIASVGPVALAMGIPLEPLALLLAVEQIPDIMRTLGNVTMDVAITTVVDRATEDGPEPVAA